MSVIRKKPFIEEVVSRLNDTNLANLQTYLDGGSANVDRSLFTAGKLITNNDKGIKGVNLELELGNIKSGILIFSDYTDGATSKTQCVLVAYHRYQDLALFQINSDLRTYERIYEECSIDELRRIVADQKDSSHEEQQTAVIPTDIAYDNNGFTLMHDTTEITGQTEKVKVKSVNGVSIIGEGNVDTKALVNVEFTNSSGVLTSTETFTSHTLLMLEIETSGVHFGVDMVLHPADESLCLVVGRVVISGQFVDVIGKLDSDGHAVVDFGANLPAGATFIAHAYEFSD